MLQKFSQQSTQKGVKKYDTTNHTNHPNKSTRRTTSKSEKTQKTKQDHPVNKSRTRNHTNLISNNNSPNLLRTTIHQ